MDYEEEPEYTLESLPQVLIFGKLLVITFMISNNSSKMLARNQNLGSQFSDIGGAAGLALGMSLATFFGALEYLIYRYISIYIPKLNSYKE